MAFVPEWRPRVAASFCRGAAPRAASASARKLPLDEPRTKATLRLEPRKRLRRPAEFKEVRRGGRRYSDNYFSLQVLANGASHPRLGLAVSTRAAGSAVARNRIKRIARESFRLNQHSLPAVDITVAARDAARGADPRALRASLADLWLAIRRRG